MKIVAAAVQVCGLTITLPPPNRHHNIIHTIAMHREAWGKEAMKHSEMNTGFITDTGEYVGREAAAIIALAVGQVNGGMLISPPLLYSEDLW